MDDSPVDMSEQLYEPLAPPPIPPLTVDQVPYAVALPIVPRLWTGFTAFGLYVFVTILVGASIIAGQIFVNGHMSITIDLVLGILAFNVVAAALVALTAAWLSPEPLLDRLQLLPGRMTTLSTFVGIITTCSIGVAFTAGFAMLAKVPELSPVLDSPDFLSDLGGASMTKLALAYLVIAAGAGIGEELLFRGYMQSRFVKRMGVHGALFTVAALFGLAHANVVQTPFAFVMGLFVGHLAYRSGSILPAMICHTANNALAVTLSTFGYVLETVESNAVMLLVALLLVVLGWLAMIRVTAEPVPRS